MHIDMAMLWRRYRAMAMFGMSPVRCGTSFRVDDTKHRSKRHNTSQQQRQKVTNFAEVPVHPT
jgi:hypothetical protein